ncbi:hypothetical protein [Catenulispora rubra]|uniref:hypothetical protein n=1 Tax=Catenulispora rubra TaxID=280293 RepID=UPI0018921479|nr:hypothetical protein [Catenulispora rubra]
MSYTLSFYTVPADELTAQLTARTTSNDPETVAKHAVELLRHLGSPVDAVDHSSAGGTWFRDRFIGEALAGLIGAEPAGHLLDRPLAGTKWTGYPSMGWLTRNELADAVSALDEAGEDALAPLDDPDSEELLEIVGDILHMAAQTHQDLVTIYS